MGQYVLQPATRREIRQAKKENFLELSASGGLQERTNSPDSPRASLSDDERPQPASPNSSISQLSPKSPLLETLPFTIARERSKNSMAAENREARIIEGTIFSRKGAAKRLSSIPFVPPMVDQRRVSSGSKWLQELRGMIRSASIKVRVSSKEL